MKTPWDFQIAACDALWNAVHERPKENPLVVMPTGSGKSLSMALFVWGMLTRYPYLRMLNLTHVKELVAGNFKALKELWPMAPAGIYSAGLGRKETHGQITYAGIGTFRNAIPLFGKIDFVIIDEAHRVSDKDNSSYVKVIKELRLRNPNLIVIGFTATDYRMGMGKLTEGGIFDSVCFDLSDGAAFVWMLDQRYLLKPVPKHPGLMVDDSKVKIRGGEFDERSASAAFREQDILEKAVEKIISYAEADNRKAWLTFCQSIDDCELVADMFREYGYPVEAVHSKRNDRDKVLEAHRCGDLIGIVNQDVLTTGYDDPRIDLIGVLRLTRSPSLWVQLLGRGTRPLWTPGYDLSTWEGRNASILASAKQNCLVLDFAGNTERLGPINYPKIPNKRKGRGGKPPVRLCPQCDAYNHISLKCCEECGYEFPVESKLSEDATKQDLVIDLNKLPPPKPPEYAVFRVKQMIAAVHPGKRGKPPTMRVDYFCGDQGLRRFSTWVCPEHGGFPTKTANDWWKAHKGAGPLPATAKDMVDVFADLERPEYIKVRLDLKYPEVVAYDFTGYAFELPPELGGPPKKLEEDLQAEAEEDRKEALREEMYYDDEIPF